MGNFSKSNQICRVLKSSTALAASTGQDSQVVDMQDYNSVTFVGIVDQTAVQGTVTLSVRGSTASGGTYQELGSASVATTTSQMDGVLAIEVDKPPFRFLQGRLVRATSDASHGGILAIKSDPKKVPVTQDSTSFLQPLVRLLNTT